MSDEPPVAPVDPELTAEIVAAFVRHNRIASDQLASLIATVHQALAGLGEPATEPVAVQTPAVSIRRSVTQNSVVCLNCGWKGQTLRRHLTAAHRLSVAEYRARWHLTADHAMTAPAYSARRSTMAKHAGFGRKFTAIAAVPETATETASNPSPKRRGRPRLKPTMVARA